jgi:hypothetical protein
MRSELSFEIELSRTTRSAPPLLRPLYPALLRSIHQPRDGNGGAGWFSMTVGRPLPVASKAVSAYRYIRCRITAVVVLDPAEEKNRLR